MTGSGAADAGEIDVQFAGSVGELRRADIGGQHGFKMVSKLGGNLPVAGGDIPGGPFFRHEAEQKIEEFRWPGRAELRVNGGVAGEMVAETSRSLAQPGTCRNCPGASPSRW